MCVCAATHTHTLQSHKSHAVVVPFSHLVTLLFVFNSSFPNSITRDTMKHLFIEEFDDVNDSCEGIKPMIC